MSSPGPDQAASVRQLREKLVQIARKEVGVIESGGNNNGPRIRDYQKATNLNPASWPWCAAFTCYVLKEWLNDPGARDALGLNSMADASRWRCKYAGAFRWEEWANRRGVEVKSERSEAFAGDFIIFDFSHIGIVAVGGKPGELLETIEGNTGPSGGRDGDGVWVKARRHTPELVRSLVRVVPNGMTAHERAQRLLSQ